MAPKKRKATRKKARRKSSGGSRHPHDMNRSDGILAQIKPIKGMELDDRPLPSL